MAFKVFISHSTADMGTVYQLKYWLEANGIEAYIAQLNPQPDTPLSEKVKDAIKACDCVIALLSADGTRSEWVHEEIGIARGANRRVVPIVEMGVQIKGTLEGREYVPFDRVNPVDAINRTVQFVHNLKLSKEAEEKTTATVLVLLGLLALATAASRNKEEAPWR